MKIRALPALCGLVLLAACEDAPPTKPDLEPGALRASVSAEEKAPRSTVCVAYDQALARANEAGDAAQVSTLETIIADACN